MSVQVEIRERRDGDEAVCADIFTRAWNTALPNLPRLITAEAFLSETDGERVLVAHRKATIVGFLSIWMADAFVHHLYVDPNFQRQGIGVALLARAAALVEGVELSLKCQVQNENAVGFYRAVGFAETSECGEDGFGHWVRLSARNIEHRGG